MDPSLGDPHHPPQFTPFPPFPTSNHFVSGAVPPLNHHPFNNNHVFQPQPQTQTQIPQPSMIQGPPHPINHPPYSEMICAAIAALNEPDGSSKMAISRYIERCHPGLTSAHAALLTHHLKTLKNSGVLTMVKKSYKIAGSSTPPASVAVAAAAAAQGLDVPRSVIHPSTNNTVNDPMAGSASQPLKRGRGRPPKPKPEGQLQQQQQPINVQPIQVQSNGQPIWQQQQVQLPVPVPAPVTESAKRGPGRPRKNGAAAATAPIVQASVMAGIMKRRGRPPGRRAAGRQRKPKSVSATASVYPYVANGARRRGRPRRVVDPSSIVSVAPVGGENVAAVAPGMKRGRGRPPKIGGVISRLMKPKRGRGRPVGRPRKFATSVTTGAQDSGELKKKFDIFQEKVKEIVKVLKDGVTSENQAVVQAIKDLEALTVTETVVEPQAMEEVQTEETAEPLTEAQQAEAAETQGGQEEGQEREGGEAQTQTEAEAMQEALF